MLPLTGLVGKNVKNEKKKKKKITKERISEVRALAPARRVQCTLSSYLRLCARDVDENVSIIRVIDRETDCFRKTLHAGTLPTSPPPPPGP